MTDGGLKCSCITQEGNIKKRSCASHFGALSNVVLFVPSKAHEGLEMGLLEQILACDVTGQKVPNARNSRGVNNNIGTAIHFAIVPVAIVRMTRCFAILLGVALLAAIAEAFTSTTFLGSRIVAGTTRALSSNHNNNGLTMKVVDVDSEAAFDKTISNAGGALVVIDYSTTWCGYVSRLIPVLCAS